MRFLERGDVRFYIKQYDRSDNYKKLVKGMETQEASKRRAQKITYKPM